ncbi:SDR family NAD(P)-dependent oxidoreductase [Streptomyces monticola]|uniref:SDR family NAD(P)-dependent oxidoreductase n=1 Tax=Streptomyces monticola TaxID=2666263 RepID=A0ABW2JR47_9ACTN
MFPHARSAARDRFDLSGSVALVTGAAGGVGRVIARQLACCEAAVAVTDIREAEAEEVVAAIRSEGGTARAFRLDVTDSASVEGAFRQVEEALGPIDVLVNNAIVANGIPAPFHEAPLDLWDRDYDVILKGAVRCARAALPGMTERGGGAIVNIVSVNAVAFYGHPSYSAAKAALISLTRSLATQYGPAGVRVNAISPGTVRTAAWDEQMRADPQTLDALTAWYPLGRIGEPDDIAAAVCFLASNSSRWTTGTVLTVDGGLTSGDAAMARVIQGS